MDIATRIIEAQVAFEIDTGREATNCYIGTHEMNELIQWAEDNSSSGGNTSRKTKGDGRSRVNGLYIFVVNADDHLVCA